METSIKIDSMFNGRSHHAAFRQHLLHRWKWWLIVRTILCIALLGIGGFMQYRLQGEEKMVVFSGILIVMGAIGLVRPMVWHIFNDRKLRKHPAYGSEIHYTFTAEAVEMNGKAGKAIVPWGEFMEVVATSKGLLLYQTKRDYLWIPSVDFKAGQMEQFLQFASR